MVRRFLKGELWWRDDVHMELREVIWFGSLFYRWDVPPERRLQFVFCAATAVVNWFRLRDNGRNCAKERFCRESIMCINSLVFRCNPRLVAHENHHYRPRVPLHSESGITRPTLFAVDVEKFLTTSRNRLALRVDTPRRRCENTTGERRPRVAALKELDACDTWRPWPENSRMDSEREHRRKSKQLELITLDYKLLILHPLYP